jgi:hypothetical protein
MRKILICTLSVLFLSGCATYKFAKGKDDYKDGYVASRDNYTIVEYTVGKDNAAASILGLAKERFKRRRNTVEDYYKKMGYIDNKFKEVVWNPSVNFLKLVTGPFRLPFVARRDYRCRKDPAYKERLSKIDEAREEKEEARINKLKDGLREYIRADIAKEPQAFQETSVSTAQPIPEQKIIVPDEPKVEEPVVRQDLASQEAAVAPEKEIIPEAKPERLDSPAPVEATEAAPAENQQVELDQAQDAQPPVTASLEEPVEQAAEEKSLTKEEELAQEEALNELAAREEKQAEPSLDLPAPVAVIIAKPEKGFSPLKVKFYGNKSKAYRAKIMAWEWDFGDGDTSNKPNPTNTYWSGSFEPKYFTVTLKVTDSRGQTATATQTIEVMNK